MKKLKLFFAALALLVGGENYAMAVTGIELTATTTDVFLYNVGGGKYLNAGDWYGTHATLSTAGMDLDLTKISDGVYTIGTRLDKRFMNGVWMDQSTSNYTFTEVDAENHYYTISWTADETTYYLKYNNNTVEAPSGTANDNTYYWQIVTRENFISSLSGATNASPMYATSMIYNAGFAVNDYATPRNADWPASRTWKGTQLTDWWGYQANVSGLSGGNWAVEQYNKSFDNYQELSGMPNGAYILKNQGFYRGTKPAYLYINSEKVAMECLSTNTSTVPDAADGYTTNAIQRSAYAFGVADKYHNTAPTCIVNDGNIRIGAYTNSETCNWSCFDNFELIYLGVPSATNGVDFTSHIVNPSFSSAYTTGWTLDGTEPNAYNSTYGTYENYHRIGGLHQDLTGLPNGVYKVTMQAAVRYDGATTGTFNLYATTSNGTTKAPATVAAHTNFATMASTMAGDATFACIETYAIVTDGNLTIGHYESEANTWPVFDNYTLTYYGAGADAYALVLASEATKASTSISGMTASSLKTAMNSTYTTKNEEATLANIQWMTFVANSASELYEASNLSSGADAIADLDYTETTSGSHSTFVDDISTYLSSVSGATATAEVTTAISTLRSAIKTYISNAKPETEGEYFDITCLIVNPSFDKNTTDGWTYTKDGGTNAAAYTCNEFYNNTFNFYQDLTGLPNGSYQLSVQAFSRPGGNGDTSAGAYYDYYNGKNEVTAELYINSQSQKVGNIYSYKNNTTGAKDNDFHCTGLGTDDYWVPNSMKGASGYFADDAYITEVAARVTDDDSGNLRIGFRDGTLTAAQWTIFDNFKLYYYGPSLARYYQQYLPQLEEQIEEDYLNNGTYDVLKSGQTERAALVTANSVNAANLDTEDEFEDAINEINDAKDDFIAAKEAYDNLDATIDEAEAVDTETNVGTGVFQLSTAKAEALASAISTAQGVYDTGTAGMSAVETAISTLQAAYTLNAPDAEKRYKLALADRGTLSVDKSSNADEGVYGLPFATAADYMAQTFFLTQTTGNNYKLSFVDFEGNTRYICAGEKAKEGLGNARIRTTTTASDALVITISATATANVFNMLNTEDSNNKIGSNGGGMYTANDYTSWSIAEASQAIVDINIASDVKYATRIFPFDAVIPEGIKVYSCEAAEGNELTLVEQDAIEANKPYILEAESGYSGDALTGWGIASATSYTEGWLTGVYVATEAPVNSYVLQKNKKNDKVAFYLVADGEEPTVGANRCYLTTGGSGSARAAFFFRGNITGVENVEAATEATLKDGKYLEKGKIVIVKNGVKYNAAGAQVK